MRMIIALVVLLSIAGSAVTLASPVNDPGVCTNDDAECCAAHPGSPNCIGDQDWDHYIELLQSYADGHGMTITGHEPSCRRQSPGQETVCQATVVIPILGIGTLICTTTTTTDGQGNQFESTSCWLG